MIKKAYGFSGRVTRKERIPHESQILFPAPCFDRGPILRALNPEDSDNPGGGRIRSDYLIRDYVVTVAELHGYVYEKVWEETNKKQAPCIFEYSDDDGRFVFSPLKSDNIPEEEKTRPAVSEAPTEQPPSKSAPKDFEQRVRDRKAKQDPVVFLPGNATRDAGKTIIEPIPDKGGAIKGTGGIHIAVEQDGVLATITRPSSPKIETPCPVILKEQPSGPYVVELKKPLYHSKRLDFIPNADIFKKEVSLDPAFGTLIIKTRPEAAAVWSDGEATGQTICDKQTGWWTCRYELMSGDHLFSIRKEHYDPVMDERITIEDGRSNTRTFKLKPNFGSLMVRSKPTGAEVRIADELRCITPCTFRNLPTGEYTLVGKGRGNRGAMVGSANVKVVWNQVKSYTLKLEDEHPPLRSAPKTLSKGDVKKMLKQHDFFEKYWNPSGDFRNDFKDNGDGTVTDQMSGRMWQQSGSDRYMDYNVAKSYINNLNEDRFAGYGDWRLPTTEELASLLEPERMSGDLSIDPIFDKRQRWCCSSDQWSSGSAWSVNFYAGIVDVNVGLSSWKFHGSRSYVRAVRF